jgi:hypothetical protein
MGRSTGIALAPRERADWASDLDRARSIRGPEALGAAFARAQSPGRWSRQSGWSWASTTSIRRRAAKFGLNSSPHLPLSGR